MVVVVELSIDLLFRCNCIVVLRSAVSGAVRRSSFALRVPCSTALLLRFHANLRSLGDTTTPVPPVLIVQQPPSLRNLSPSEPKSLRIRYEFVAIDPAKSQGGGRARQAREDQACSGDLDARLSMI